MPDELETAFSFNSEDLSHNRQGRLSPRQAAQLARTGRRQKVTLTVATLVSGVLAFILLYPTIQARSLATVPLGPVIGGLVLAGLALLFFSGLFNKPDANVKHVEGPVQFVSSDYTTQVDDHLQSTTVLNIVVGAERFPVKDDQYQAFQQGHRYRVYYGAAASLDILSIEYIGPPQTAR